MGIRERQLVAFSMRRRGVRFSEIASYLEVSPQRAYQIYQQARARILRSIEIATDDARRVPPDIRDLMLGVEVTWEIGAASPEMRG